MSYAVSAALQSAIYTRLTSDAALTALVGGAIYDALPPGVAPSLYVVIGPEKVRDRSDQTGRGAEHELVVSVVTDVSGFAGAKAAAGAISDALVDAPLALSRGQTRLDRLSSRGRRASWRRWRATDRPHLSGPRRRRRSRFLNSNTGGKAMVAQNGKDLLIKIDMGGGVYQTVAGLRATRISFNAESVDVTTLDSQGGWRELLSRSGCQVGIDFGLGHLPGRCHGRALPPAVLRR